MRNNHPEVPKQLSSPNSKSNRALSHAAAEGDNLGEVYLDCGPLDADEAEPWRPTIDTLKKIYQVPSAADLHPSLAFADNPWPSPSFGTVFPGVLEQLRKVRGFLIVKGFNVDADPVNPLGDGKSWALVVERTHSSTGADPLELVRQCQAQIVSSRRTGAGWANNLGSSVATQCERYCNGRATAATVQFRAQRRGTREESIAI